MSIASEITRLQNAKSNIKTSIENKGVTVPNNATLDAYSGYIDNIQTGLMPDVYNWDAMNSHMKDYLDEVDYSSDTGYTSTSITSYAPSSKNSEYYDPIGKSVTLPAGELEIDGNRETVSAGSKTIYNIIPNKYTPFNVISNNNIVKSGLLHPTGQVRVIKSSSAYNIRDLGGWKTYDSNGTQTGTIKYGKMFRGSDVEASDIDTLVNKCGVRWDLNLRGGETAILDRSVLGNVGYTYPNYGSTYIWYRACLYEANRTAMTEVFDCVLNVVTDGSPLYIHCAEGMDRTGTLSCLIEGLLGCKLSDMDKDYELTNFYSTTASSTTMRARNEAEWKNLITDINALTGSTVQEKIGRWLINTLGFNAKKVNDFRNYVIDGTVEQFTHVTNTLTNCTTSNSETLYLGSGSYTTTITPNTGYILDNGNAQVLLNGIDITSTAYSDGVINVSSINGGELVINVEAVEYVPVYTNVFDYTTATINKRFKTDNTPYDQNGYFLTDFIACDLSSATQDNPVLVRFRNCAWASNAKAVYYNSSQSVVASYMKAYTNVQTDGNGDAYIKAGWGESTQGDASTDHSSSSIAQIRYIRFALQKSSSALSSVNDLQDVIITLDEPIN